MLPVHLPPPGLHRDQRAAVSAVLRCANLAAFSSLGTCTGTVLVDISVLFTDNLLALDRHLPLVTPASPAVTVDPATLGLTAVLVKVSDQATLGRVRTIHTTDTSLVLPGATYFNAIGAGLVLAAVVVACLPILDRVTRPDTARFEWAGAQRVCAGTSLLASAWRSLFVDVRSWGFGGERSRGSAWAGARMRFALLGPVEAWAGDERVALGPPQQRCLVAALALEPDRVLSVDRLADIVWAGKPPQSARNALQVSVSRLRRVFRGSTVDLVTRSPGYLLAVDPDNVDVHRFGRLVAEARAAADDPARAELLRAALALWRGPAMEDLDPGVRQRLATALDELRWSAVEDLVAVDLRLARNAGELIEELRELVRAQPVRERLAAHYMTVLCEAGCRAEALAHYRLVAERLRDELGVEPGGALTALHVAILRGERPAGIGGTGTQSPGTSTTAAGSGTTGRPREARHPRRQVPQQLPPPATGFTGRAAELAELGGVHRAARTGGLPGVAALVGTAGVGKTALALQWGHQRAAEFPDGRLYLDLQGYGGRRRLEPASALERLLRLLGVSGGEIPAGVEERSALFRSCIASRTMLVVLDNARSSADVRPLLPAAPGSFTVVTSRNRLHGLVARDGVPAVPVRRLPADDARRLLDTVSRVPVPPQAADRLVALCDNLPLAVRIAAARLASGDVDAVIAELSDTRHRLEALSVEDGDSAIRTVLVSSYQAVPSDAARLLRLLGLLPGDDVDGCAAAALLGAPPAEARRLLELLADEHLLERRNGGRYGTHDLIRLLAAGLAEREETGPDRRAALRRLLRWYAHAVHAAEAALNPLLVRLTPDPADRPAYTPTFETVDAALAFLDGERANLFPAVRAAHAAGLAEELWHLANGLYTYLRRRYEVAEFITFYEWGLAAAAAAGRPEAEAVMAAGLGIAYSFARRVPEALDAYRRAEALFAAVGDLELQARTRMTMGCIRMEAGDHDRAEEDLARATADARRAGSLLVEGACLSSRALLRIWRGRPDEAEPFLVGALAVAGALDRPYWLPNVHEYQGDLSRARGDYADAVRHYEDALAAARAIGERVIEARVLSVLAESLVKAGDRKCGRQRMAEALDLAGSIRGPLAIDIERRLADLDRPRTAPSGALSVS